MNETRSRNGVGRPFKHPPLLDSYPAYVEEHFLDDDDKELVSKSDVGLSIKTTLQVPCHPGTQNLQAEVVQAQLEMNKTVMHEVKIQMGLQKSLTEVQKMVGEKKVSGSQVLLTPPSPSGFFL